MTAAKKPTTKRKVSKKKAGTARVKMTISVPGYLKEQMDSVTEDVNWSAEACHGFRMKLGELGYPELLGPKKRKTGPLVERKVKARERKHKHGVERRDITKSAIKVLAAGMRTVFDINKSGLYALRVMNSKRGVPAFVAQQEANDIVEEILYQYDRLVKILNVNVGK